MKLADMVAIVTGASRGIGRATELALAREGAHVVVAARTASQLEEVAEEIRATGRRGLVVKTDVTQEEDIEHLVQRTLEEFGRVDILVNNAGAIVMKPFLDTTLEEFDHMHAVNLRSTFILMKAVLPIMVGQGGGKIINFSSVSGQQGYEEHCAYSAAKAGVIRLTESAADEMKQHDININVICPQAVDTDLFGDMFPDLDRSRWAKSDEVAELIVYLCSPVARPITGASLVVSGMHE